MESAIAVVISIIWTLWARKRIFKLEKLDPSAWILERRELETVEHEALRVVDGNYETEKSDVLESGVNVPYTSNETINVT